MLLKLIFSLILASSYHIITQYIQKVFFDQFSFQYNTGGHLITDTLLHKRAALVSQISCFIIRRQKNKVLTVRKLCRIGAFEAKFFQLYLSLCGFCAGLKCGRKALEKKCDQQHQKGFILWGI